MDSTWTNRPSERLDEHDAQRARAEAGLLPTLATVIAIKRCPTCRRELRMAQYGTAGRDWCGTCEPQHAPPPRRCVCGAPATTARYSSTPLQIKALDLCAPHAAEYDQYGYVYFLKQWSVA